MIFRPYTTKSNKNEVPVLCSILPEHFVPRGFFYLVYDDNQQIVCLNCKLHPKKLK